MRPRREYLPYSLTLKKFRHDKHPGTDIPKKLSSLVQLKNRARGEERDVLIAMNQPLRHGGKAFYQASLSRARWFDVPHKSNPSVRTPDLGRARGLKSGHVEE